MRLLTVLLVIAGGLAVAALPLTSAALIVAGGAVVIATLIRPEVSLCLLVFSVPFGGLRSVSIGGMSVTATEVLVALLGAAWLARGVILREIRIAHAPLILPLLLLLATQILSLFDALSLSMAAKELLKWAEILAVYVIASSILTDHENLALTPSPGLRVFASSRLCILVSLLFAAALAEALLGIYQFVLRAGPEWFVIGRFMRAYGTFAQPNPYAGYLNLTLPLGYALLLAGNHNEHWIRRKDILLIGCLAIIGVAFLMSLSRGAWLGLAVAVAAISLRHSRRSAAFTVSGGVLAAALLILSSANLLPTAITSRFSSITDYVRIFDVRHVEVTDANFAVVERMAHWQAAWDMINDRPWLGFGAGNYPAAYPTYALAGWKEPLGHAHNVILNTWAETGVIGLAAYLIFLAVALWTCRPRRAVECDAGLPHCIGQSVAPGAAFARAIALGVFGVLLAKITHEMLDNLWVHSMGVQVALLLAMVYAAQPGAHANNT
jgi:O-antigen ligase